MKAARLWLVLHWGLPQPAVLCLRSVVQWLVLCAVCAAAPAAGHGLAQLAAAFEGSLHVLLWCLSGWLLQQGRCAGCKNDGAIG
jgi:hypothetical protein